LFNLLLAGTKIVQRRVEIVFVERTQAENFADRVVRGPTHCRQTRALMRNAGQDQK